MRTTRGTRAKISAQRLGAMIDKRKAQHLVGETIRDIGILVLVFAPLDAFFREQRTPPVPLTLICGVGLLCIGLGIMLEARE